MKEKEEKKASISLTRFELEKLRDLLDAIILSESDNEVFGDIQRKTNKALKKLNNK